MFYEGLIPFEFMIELEELGYALLSDLFLLSDPTIYDSQF